MKQILMCRPTKFNVDYVINPWMTGNIDKVDQSIALQQWESLYQVLKDCGANVILTDEQPDDCPDAVFTANAGLAYKDLFITSKFMHKERQNEEPFFYAQAAKIGFKEVPINKEWPNTELKFEGAGDALFSHDHVILWMGYGFRSHYGFHSILHDAFHIHTIALHLKDPRWYHLDTCFCPLDTGEVLWYPEAFDGKSQKLISSIYQGKLIAVSEEDAVRFACNSISIENQIIMPHISDELREYLNNRGYSVMTVDMSQFLRSGGACKCLTLELVK